MWLALVLPSLAFGWGAGHDAVARAVASRLPQPWCERLQGVTLQQFCADNHYPDSFELFPVERVGPETLDYIRGQGITKRYDLHSDKGRAVAFCMLTRSIKENQPDRALLWLACLAHSTADMAACNHDPVVHIATYGWCTAEWGMKLPGGRAFSKVTPCLDLSWVEKEPWAEAVFERQSDACALKDCGESAAAELLEVMLYGVRGAEGCAPHGPLVLSAAAEWVVAADRHAGERLAEELSALGAWAVARTLRDFQVAVRLASAEPVPEVTPAVLARYETEMDAFVKTRLLPSDLFTQSALTPSGMKGPGIGVLIEPCWRMDEGLFGFGDRVLAVQTVNTLRRRGKNAELVDVRQFLDKGAEMPTLIVPAQRCASYRTLKTETLNKQLRAFLDAGGKVVWVGGGKPLAALCRGMPKDFLVKGDGNAWPVPLGKFRSGKLSVAGGAEWSLAHSPEGSAGWHWPSNPFFFTQDAVSQGVPLARWSGEGQSKCVGLAWPKGKPSVAYLPTYAVSPYVWTVEPPTLAPLRLDLDAAGVAVLEAAMEAL